MEEQALWNIIVERRTSRIGHTLKQFGSMKNIIEGKMEGIVPRGKPRAQLHETNEEESTLEEISLSALDSRMDGYNQPIYGLNDQ
jgi:hypothetical protein